MLQHLAAISVSHADYKYVLYKVVNSGYIARNLLKYHVLLDHMILLQLSFCIIVYCSWQHGYSWWGWQDVPWAVEFQCEDQRHRAMARLDLLHPLHRPPCWSVYWSYYASIVWVKLQVEFQDSYGSHVVACLRIRNNNNSSVTQSMLNIGSFAIVAISTLRELRSQPPSCGYLQDIEVTVNQLHACSAVTKIIIPIGWYSSPNHTECSDRGMREMKELSKDTNFVDNDNVRNIMSQLIILQRLKITLDHNVVDMTVL